MKRCDRGQADQGEVLDDCCHVTSVSGTLRSEGHVITVAEEECLSSRQGVFM